MKKTNRIAALVLALIMCLGMLGTASAAPSDVQIPKDKKGGTVYYDTAGTQYTSGTLGEDNIVVEMSKKVAGTDVENEFEITLQVKTNQKLKEISTTSPDAAVLLIIDTSGSMNWSYKDNQTRLEAAKAAAKKFVEDFVGTSDTGKRMVGLISFNLDANAINLSGSDTPDYWVDARTDITNINNAITYLGTHQGTNIEGGLKLAENLLNEGKKSADDIKGIDHIYTILLTDGEPTAYISGNAQSPTQVKGSHDNFSTKKETVDSVGQTAYNIKTINNNSLSKLYSICFGTNGDGETVWNSKPFGDWKFKAPNSVNTTEEMTIGQWLTKFSDRAYDAQNAQFDLFDSFDSIIQLIQVAAQAWQVDDSMGDRIKYLSAVPVNNKAGNGIIHNEVSVGEDGAIHWNILGSGTDDNITDITTTPDGTMINGVLGYTYKYRVNLDNLDGYVAGTNVPTNTKATLDYMVTDNEGNWIPQLYEGIFPVPEVKGLQGSLEFTKVDDQGKPLSGAEFTLTLKGETGWTSKTVTSGNDGKISFTNIPSGHEYTLTETVTPDGYVSANPINVSVDFGVTTASGFDGTPNNPTVINIRKVAEVTVTKTFEGLPKELWPNVTVTLTSGNKAFKTILNAANEWTDAIEVDAPGTYTISEDPAVVEDWELIKKEHPSEVTVAIGDKKNIALVNTYKKVVGDLVVTKDVAGDLTEKDFAGKSITFHVTGPDGYTGPASFTLPESDNTPWAWSVSNVPLGTYTITESGADVENYTLVTTFNGNESESVSIDLTKDGASIEVINTYEQDVGELTITKTFSGDPVDVPEGLSFTITGPYDYSATVAYTEFENGSYTIKGLPVGKYTVTESNTRVSGHTVETTYTAGNTADVIKDGSATVAVNNEYTKIIGDLIVTKDVAGDLTEKDFAGKSITFHVTGPDGYTGPAFFTLPESDNTPWAWSVSNVPLGTYTITESGADVNDYNLKTSFMVNGEAADTATVNLTKAGATIDITNTYTLGEAASLEIPVRKIVERGESGNIDPFGNRVYQFKMAIADHIIPRGKVTPGTYEVTFNGTTITPVHGVYTFELTVSGLGSAEGLLKINANPTDLRDKKIIISELSATETGYLPDITWTYDETVYDAYIYESDNGFGVELSRTTEPDEEWDGVTAEFKNIFTCYTEPPKTGDNSQLGLWTALMVLSAAGYVFTMKRRSSQN